MERRGGERHGCASTENSTASSPPSLFCLGLGWQQAVIHPPAVPEEMADSVGACGEHVESEPWTIDVIG